MEEYLDKILLKIFEINPSFGCKVEGDIVCITILRATKSTYLSKQVTNLLCKFFLKERKINMVDSIIFNNGEIRYFYDITYKYQLTEVGKKEIYRKALLDDLNEYL